MMKTRYEYFMCTLAFAEGLILPNDCYIHKFGDPDSVFVVTKNLPDELRSVIILKGYIIQESHEFHYTFYKPTVSV